MAQNEIEYGQGLNQVLSRRFGVQGAPSPFMASEVFPTLVLGNDRPEWGFLQQERRAGGNAADAAVAAQSSQVGVTNPSGSNAIVVITRIIVNNSTAGALLHNIGIGNSVTVDNLGSSFFLDTRLGFATQRPTANVFLLTQATGIGNIIAQVTAPAAQWAELQGAWILGPNGFLVVRGALNQQAVSAAFEWYEYAASPGELFGVST